MKQKNTKPVIRQHVDFTTLLIGLMLAAALLLFGNAQAQTVPRCKATTKAGKPCKGSPGKDDFCYFHSPARVRCGAQTAAKKECKMIVSKLGDKCRFHKN